ncbi:MAG: glycosyltransferase family 4 protein [Proteobacteria bacterium]|nr:glycosyltransferase family 4 protein [Pseudomonadota bacterium]
MHDIALIIGHMGNGGTQRVFATMSNRWSECGRKVCVITQAAPATDFYALHPSVKRLVFGRREDSNKLLRGLIRNIARISSLRQALREADARVSLAAMPSTAVLTILAGIGLPTRVIVAERNDPSRQSHGLIWDLLRRLLYPRAALVTANSKGVLDSLKAYVPEHLLELLPNPIQPHTRKMNGGARRPIILNVGRLHAQKAQDVLIEAFASIADDFPQWRLAIAGAGKLEHSLRELAEKCGVARRVDWLGEVTDIWKHYEEASIFALPSRHEGMPNALLEAMNAGLPAIVTQASPGPLELVEDQIHGLVVPVDDPAALATALRTLIGDPALRVEQGRAGRERSKAFELDAVMRRWEQVLGLQPVSKQPAPL